MRHLRAWWRELCLATSENYVVNSDTTVGSREPLRIVRTIRGFQAPRSRLDAPMSSGYRPGRRWQLRRVLAEPAIDLVRELPPERAHGLGLVIAERDPSSHLGPSLPAKH